MADNDLLRIVNEAVPLRECPIKRTEDIHRRLWLLQTIKKYCEKQLAQQFNAKEAL